MGDFKNLLKDYLEQYPNEENPLNWHNIVSEEEIYFFLKNRKGRKILIKTDPEKLDGGQLIYG